MAALGLRSQISIWLRQQQSFPWAEFHKRDPALLSAILLGLARCLTLGEAELGDNDTMDGEGRPH